MHAPVTPGTTFEVRYPFIHDTVTFQDEDGPYTETTWRPGMDRQHETAEGEGLQLLQVVTTCVLGGRYQERVFYTQQWQDPDGKRWGKTAVRMCTLRRFRTMLQGYAYPYSLPGQRSVREREQAEYDAALAARYSRSGELVLAETEGRCGF